MFHKSFLLLVIGLWGVIVLPLPNRVSAITPLTRAEIQNLRNLVQLIPKDRHKKRPARKLDAMTPGDGLSTGRASLADLRFNDGSLARVGEQAVFQFLPKTRSFKLSNGTALLLIPPGRGQTRIQTPSAAAAIRGSALFVRYNQQTDTTIVGALTNSGIEVSNKEASQTQVLQAGQMMVIVKGKFQGLYDFDLRNFYETSDMVRGLDLTKQNLTPTADPAIASVQAETAAALNAQSPITGEGVVENPSFAELTPSPSTSSTNETITSNSPADPIEDDSPLNSFEDIGQVLLNTEQQSGINSNNNPATQNNNLGVDFTRTPAIPQNPLIQPTPGGTGTTINPDPAGGGTGTTINPDPAGGGTGTTINPDPAGGGTGTTINPDPGGGTGTTINPDPGGGTGTTINPDPGGGTGTTINPDPGGGTGTTINPDPAGGGTGTTINPDPAGGGTGTTINPDPAGGGTGTTINPDPGSGTGTTINPDPGGGTGTTINPDPTGGGTGTTINPDPTGGGTVTPVTPDPTGGGPGTT